MTFIKNNSYLLLVIALCITFTFIGTNKIGSEPAFEEIIISEGDTLWGLSVYYSENTPKKQWIQKVMDLNNLSTTNLRIGDDLKMPIIKKVKDENMDIAKLASGDK
ncbi:LysM peptidoglycan-binding domain-containing protein [Sporosarcina siberiensis]|uniref:LysM peptidoglycan-binding domain-containing protein n=1 Tax=Sporosarcina siberiensis TaxID=1365606 RepID=A0ABW4SGI6_9BACL